MVYAPKVDKFDVSRCNSGGAADDEGQYAAVTLKLSIGNSAGLSCAQCRLYYKANDYPEVGVSPYVDLTSRISALVSGVTLNTSILTGVWSLGSVWNFALVFIAGEETAIGTASMARGSTSFHISDDPGGGAAVGGFSTGTSASPKFESHVPAHFYGGIDGVTIYTSGEVNTGGKWIDGKPIYRYMLDVQGSFKSATTVIGVLPSTVDVMVEIRGTFTRNDGGWRTIPYCYFGNQNWDICVYTDASGNVSLQAGSAYTSTARAIVLFEYTKK